VINDDDQWADLFKREIREKFGESVEIATYGKSSSCTLQIVDSSTTSKGTVVVFKYAQNIYNFTMPLFGNYNVYNLALALLMCLSGGHALDKLLKNVEKLHIPGRFELLDFGNALPKVVVDFAHTPNAVEHILQFVDANRDNSALFGAGKVITIIGQPGGRDAIKRPEVGKAVGQYSDYAIFTADDPRMESVEKICAEIISGIEPGGRLAQNF
jgi:UDP-N-acetylmuramoyl-L-alanyl-D-glutamate--2,6-diaminopimelate ligase